MSNNRNLRYHPLLVSLHWLVVILIFAAFLLGKSMSGLPNDPAKISLLALHMLLGLTTLIVIVLRVIARFRLPRPASATTGNAFLDWVGKAVHYALYLLVFLMALSGMSLSLQSGLLAALLGAEPAELHMLPGEPILYCRAGDKTKELAEKLAQGGMPVAFLENGFLGWEAVLATALAFGLVLLLVTTWWVPLRARRARAPMRVARRVRREGV